MVANLNIFKMKPEIFIFLVIIAVVCAKDTSVERKKKYYGFPAFLCEFYVLK